MLRVLHLSFLTLCCSLSASVAAEPNPTAAEKASYYKQIRPIFQAHCQGCHQPAKQSGSYVMTDHDRLLKGGESGEAAVVPGKADGSHLVKLISPKDGKAEMPKNKSPLAESEIELVKKWIAEGAVDDTPKNAVQKYDNEHPPVYSRLPVVTSLDFSPDGQLLAIAGFHEVLLWKADGSELVGRLIGLAERIESVKFSPDGSKLLATGGQPGRMGEVQVWNVAEKKLVMSVPVTFDTVYGGSWSPDGKLIALGCADNSVRAFDATTGEQVLFQGAHNDWVRGTVFSMDGSNLLSVSRDMTTKLTEVATQRFVDNVTSITPNALKGGTQCIDRHPQRDEIAVGGSDGVCRVYRIFRLTNRVIGDDANLIREMPEMKGRIFSVAISRDGKRIVAGSALDGGGEVNVYSYEFDTKLPDNIRAINSKVVDQRNADEKAALAAYHKQDVKQISETLLPNTGVYAVAFRPDGQVVAAAGQDGTVRLIDAATGKIQKEFPPVAIAAASQVAATAAATEPVTPVWHSLLPSLAEEKLPSGAKLVALDVLPNAIQLGGKHDYVQLLVTAKLESGDLLDVTRLVKTELTAPLAEVSPMGTVRGRAPGQAMLRVTLQNLAAEIPVNVAATIQETAPAVSFIRDVNPVLSRIGCNQGTCHGAANGKNGFRLSLRGYDALVDVRAFTDDLASRRVNWASPDDSLMLLKSTGAVPHVGGLLIRPGESYYQTIRNWIAAGAKLDLTAPRVTKIEIQPSNPIVQLVGARQQMRIVATYTDGKQRDVTHEAYIETGNMDIASAARGGIMIALRRGEAPVLARYEGAYTATTLTVMGDRTGFVWQQPPANNRIDELAAAKWQRMKIKPSELCGDAEFLRRIHIDLTGLPPTIEQVKAFLEDQRESRVKRDNVIDQLVGGEDYVEYWTNKWADMLQVNRKFLGVEGAAAFRKWIRTEVAQNTPYDQFAYKVLTASGSNKDNPAASYYKILRAADATMENTTHLFLGVRFNCNKCHDHPFERWTQDQYYETAAFFSQYKLDRDPASGGSNIGGTAVEGAKPLYEVVSDMPTGEMIHDRTKAVAPPKFPFECNFTAKQNASRREQLAGWITSRDNSYFARSYVNRIWGYLFGVGIMEPIDDLRAGNPPTNPELLSFLTDEFLKSNFDVRHVTKLICKSRTYQLSVETQQWNADDKINYSHATARRLPAEVLYDAIYRVTGTPSRLPGGVRAAAIPDSGIDLPSGFFGTFGRPVRESACECERTTGLQLGPVMALISGPTVAEAISDASNAITRLVAAEQDDRKVVNEIVLRILNRPAREKEIDETIKTIAAIEQDHVKLTAAVQKREADYAPTRTKLEQERETAVAAAKTELDAYAKEAIPKLAELEKQKVERTGKLTAELKDYESKLQAKFDEWLAQQKSGGIWTALDPTALKATTGAKLTKEADLSVLAEQKTGPVTYTFTAETPLKNITGIQLEALADDRLPARGPGLAQNGNFVLTEFDLKAAPKATPNQLKPVKLENAQADFSQASFDVKTAVDGQRPNQSNGWAISAELGKSHWATFEIKEPLGQDGGTILTFTLDQRYLDNMHHIGRFRISVTQTSLPLPPPTLPADISSVLAVAADQRTPEQKEKLVKFFFSRDGEWAKRQQAVAESQKPLPVDPKLKELQDKLQAASQPVPADRLLTRLTQDLDLSGKQLVNKRLTAAQDLVWALLNSPEFLFNH